MKSNRPIFRSHMGVRMVTVEEGVEAEAEEGGVVEVEVGEEEEEDMKGILLMTDLALEGVAGM